MKIVLSETVFCVTGSFSSFQNTRVVSEAIRDAGGQTTASVGQRTQVLVLGTGYSQKPEDARARGLPIIDEAQLHELFREGHIDVDFQPPQVPQGGEGLDALLGEARSLLACTPSMEVWGQIVALLGRCSIEQMSNLTSYIQSHIERWSDADQLFCVAPEEWLATLYKGESSEAYHLIRWLDLTKARASVTGFKNLFKSEELTHVRHLYLPAEKPLSKTIYALIARSERYKSVEVLIFGMMVKGMAQGLNAGDALHGVRALGMTGPYFRGPYDQLLDALNEGPFNQVDTNIGFRSGFSFMNVEREQTIPVALQGVRTLVWDCGIFEWYMAGGFERIMVHMPALRESLTRVSTLHLLVGSEVHAGPKAWDFSHLCSLTTLHIYIDRAWQARQDLERALSLHEMTGVPALKQLVTNIPLHSPHIQTFAQAFPDVELIEARSNYTNQ